MIACDKNQIRWSIILDKDLDQEIKKDFKFYYDRKVIGKDKPNDKKCYYDINSCLTEAKNNNYKYLLVNYEGTFIIDNDAYIHRIIKFINDLNQEEWLVAGHIIDDENSGIFWNRSSKNHKWYYLWPITLLINIETWTKLGSPKIETSDYVNYSSLPSIKRSEENIHDNYTPLWISASNNPSKLYDNSLIEVKNCFNLIKLSIENNYKVFNIPENVRRFQHYTYPENSPVSYNETFNSLRSINFDKINISLFSKLLSMLENNQTGKTNAFNSEGLTTLIGFDYYKNSYKKIDTIINTCQGFKDFVFSFGNDCPDIHEVKFIHYDISPNNINLRKKIIECWDGKLESLIELGFIKQEVDFVNMYNELLSKFNNVDDFIKKWNIYKNCHHEYIVQNLFFEYQEGKIKNLIKKLNSKNVLLFFSDVFQWQDNFLTRGNKNINDSRVKFLNHIAHNLDMLLIESKSIKEDLPNFEIYYKNNDS